MAVVFLTGTLATSDQVLPACEYSMTMVSAPAVSASVCGGAHDRLTEQSESERTVRLVGGLDGSVNERERERERTYIGLDRRCVWV